MPSRTLQKRMCHLFERVCLSERYTSLRPMGHLKHTSEQEQLYSLPMRQLLS